MKVLRVWAVARKEFLHVLRDYRSLMMAIAIPIMMLVLFGYALTLDVDNVPLVVWDQSGTTQSREFIARFGGLRQNGSRFFSIRGAVENQQEMDFAIDSGQALCVLVVPREFAQKLASGRATEVQLIIDGSDSNTATIALSYAQSVVQGYSQEIVLQTMRRQGLPEPNTPIDAKPRVWFNEDLESKNFIVPGLIAVLMMVISALLTSLTIAREWEQGTMEQLISTPVKGHELIVGKLIPYFVIGLFDVLLAVLMAEFVFDVPLRGSVLFLFSIAVVFLIGALSMGLVISINLKNQLLAAQFAMVATFLPSFLLSGFMFSIANMPQVIQYITYIVPARYFVAALKGIYMKGVGPTVLFAEVVFLMIYSLVMFTIANVRFKKKLS
jgi:ABC-2 type transport system permease protein